MEVQSRRLREMPSRRGASSRRQHFSQGRKNIRRNVTETGFREMLVQQCIASGLVLFVALSVSFLPLSFAIELRSGVKRALSQEGSADGFLDIAGGLTNRYESLLNSIKLVFQEPSAGVADQWQNPDAPIEIDYSPGTGIPSAADEPADDYIQVAPDMEVRIDENVLRGLNTGEFYEVDGSEKKR